MENEKLLDIEIVAIKLFMQWYMDVVMEFKWFQQLADWEIVEMTDS